MNECDGSGDVYETEVTFPSDADFFEGHFPGHLVTPGVILLGRAVEAAERLMGRKARLASVRKMKFTNPVLSDETLRLRVERRTGEEFAYAFRKSGSVSASGILVFQG